MYNHTNGAQAWRDRIQGYLDNTQRVFFTPHSSTGKIMTEYACEPINNCNKDQRSFKAYLSRWLAVCAQLAPFTQPQILPWIQESSLAAVRACTLTNDAGVVGCGRTWYENRDDGLRDVGQQMSAMSIVQSNMILGARPLVDLSTGDSRSDPAAGGGLPGRVDSIYTRKMTAGDRAGAWIVTAVALVAFVAAAVAMVLDREEPYTGYVGNSPGVKPGA
jgi:mannan endo-1,6-alpha-mannosidase